MMSAEGMGNENMMVTTDAIILEDGEAILMDNDVVTVLQESDQGPQSVVLRRTDLERLLGAFSAQMV